MSTSKPVKAFRMGNINCAVWAHTSKDNRTFHNVTFSRSYRDEKGEWHETNSFGTNDLPRIISITGKAYDWIHEERRRLAKKGKKTVDDTGETF